MTPRERLIVALDVAGPAEALALVERLSGAVGMFKVGSQLFTAAGPGLVRELVGRGERVFLDLKYHDIPHTVAGAVAAAAELGVTLVDVHALGGRAMLAAAAAATRGATRLLAVTVLTSHDAASLAELGVSGTPPEAVARLAELARRSGAHGVVASAEEARLVRESCGPGFLVVTPGIRPAGSPAGDQARFATPAGALGEGADYLVVGRPITAAPDPLAAALAIVDEMTAGD